MSTPKLFHLCSHFYPATSIGGPIFCGIELLINLDTIATQKIFAYSTSIDTSKWSINLNKQFPFANNSTISLVRHDPISYFILTYGLISAIIEKRCIFVHGTYNPQYVFAFLLLRLFNHKCFIIPHGTLDLNRRKSSNSFLIRHLSYLYIKHILYANHLVFTNFAEYSAVNIKHPRERNLHFIQNFVPSANETAWIGLLSPILRPRALPNVSIKQSTNTIVDLEDRISNFLTLTSDHPSTKRPLTLFFFGRLSPEKGLDIVLPTLSRLYHDGYIKGIVILGGTEDKVYEQYICTQCASFSLPLFITGFLPRPEAHNILKLFRPALIFPSVADNFNLCLHECLALGLRSIASTRINTVDDLKSPLVTSFTLENASQELYQLIIQLCLSSADDEIESPYVLSNPSLILDSYKELLLNCSN